MQKEKLNVQVFGSGCAKCEKTKEIVSEFLSDNKIAFKIEKVKDQQAILDAGIMMTPALAINGEILFQGQVPRRKELKKWIEKNF
jgi:small redox-active disulfide protein 2